MSVRIENPEQSALNALNILAHTGDHPADFDAFVIAYRGARDQGVSERQILEAISPSHPHLGPAANDYRRYRRARRIADVAVAARAMNVDGDWAIVCDDFYAFDVAERLAWSSAIMHLDVYTSDQVTTCDNCFRTESNSIGGFPRGWVEIEDAHGDLVGYHCEDCRKGD